MCFEKVVYMEVSWFVESEHSNGARLSTDADSIQHNFTIHTMKVSWKLALIILALGASIRT